MTNISQYDILNLSVRGTDFLCQNAPLVCAVEPYRSSDRRRTGGFLLENKMEQKKICYRCQEKLNIRNFYKFKTGINKNHLRSYCKKCSKAYCQEYRSRNPRIKTQEQLIKNVGYQRKYQDRIRKYEPWKQTLIYARGRCRGKTNKYYFQAGRKCFLTEKEIKTIWHRDKAWLLRRPSIDRINNDGNYTFKNCRFIELSENVIRKNLGRNTNPRIIICIETGQEYPSIKNAMIKLNIQSRSKFYQALNGKKKNLAGFHWKYKDNNWRGNRFPRPGNHKV